MMLPDTAPVAAADIVEMLRRHYLPEGRPAGGIFAAEIEAPDGVRRADAIWAPWSIAGGSALVGHEVKVSRSDVLTELADPMKAEPWSRYCRQWWLVVADPRLVAGLTIPDAWGVMSPPSGRRRRTMTVVRAAPLLKPSDSGPAWRRIALWQDTRLSKRMYELEYKAQWRDNEIERLQRELAERQLAGEGRAHPQAVAVGRVLAILERERYFGSRFEPEEVAAAIADLDRIRRLTDDARRDLEYLVDEVRRNADPLRHVAEQLAKLGKPKVAA